MRVSLINFSKFRLDGGAMFGSVPKNLWSRKVGADEENCIKLVSRSVLIETEKRKILVDVGLGDKWSEKERKIFGIENASMATLDFKPEEITDLVLTHLHFDHAGGISKFGADGKVEPVYPKAQVFLQRANLKNARNPNVREKASYLKDNVDILETLNVTLLEDEQDIIPGIKTVQCDGHTKGQQWVEIDAGSEYYMFATDLIPTSHHLPIPWNMGYDICTATLLKEKEIFLQRALEKEAVVIFQHDPEVPAAKVLIDAKGHYGVKEAVKL